MGPAGDPLIRNGGGRVSDGNRAWHAAALRLVAALCLLASVAAPEDAAASSRVELTFEGRIPTQCALTFDGDRLSLGDLTQPTTASLAASISCNANYSVRAVSSLGQLQHETLGDSRTYAPNYRGALPYEAVMTSGQADSTGPISSAALRDGAILLNGRFSATETTAHIEVRAPGQTTYPLIPGAYRDDLVITILPRG